MTRFEATKVLWGLIEEADRQAVYYERKAAELAACEPSATLDQYDVDRLANARAASAALRLAGALLAGDQLEG